MRKTAVVKIEAEGRDKGKQFIITEMAAEPLEDWALRALLGIMKHADFDPSVGQELLTNGAAGLASLGMAALMRMDHTDLRPLLEEMMACVELIPDPTKPDIKVSISAFPEQIEEVATRVKLRSEWFVLNLGFSIPGVR